MMKSAKIIIFAFAFIMGCSNPKYPNWEYVRIEQSLPNDKCEYKIQESCPPTAWEGCFNWYKKRATKFNANTVIIEDNRLANYYSCPQSGNTDNYGNATSNADSYGNNTNNSVKAYENTVYSRDECIGPVIMGECKGNLVPKGGYHKTCHGTMLNGRCTGPMF